ncbi:FAD-dependent monooxygenase [Zoogloea sp.]|uniref:FAD-dependent monooxygenase n=1 Tax=Zoogloea sp. TaxID=49181 RepID=UPI0026217628|nr:FAD-dependent monooxygenase [Zoogloea sp.]MDD3352122.1 FAD-dependent monooxygenase [Zoogloea sp.]
MDRHDIAIVGAGPVGMALALALKDSGLDTVLVDARPRGGARQDPRILALSHGTRLTLERLGIWSRLQVTPIETIHISHQGGLGRTLLRTEDYGQPAMGYVVAAGDLAAALDDALQGAGIPVRDNTPVIHLAPGAEDVLLGLGDGSQLAARLAACAEGVIQGAGGTPLVEQDYGQHAIISVATPADAHHHRAWERFTPQGPLAVLPWGNDCAIVHTAHPDEAAALMALDDDAYRERLQASFGSRLRFARVGPRACYPLVLRYRPNPVGQRTVWLGNAAQTLHPVAGQGYNLALRDVWACAQTLIRAGGDPGIATTLATYARERRLDRQGTIRFTDGLVKLFSTGAAPLRHARGAGLFALDLLPPARHFVAKRMMFGARAWP